MRILSAIVAAAIGISTVAAVGCRDITESESGTYTASDSDSVVNYTDASGALVSLIRSPERVAVLFSSFADIWVGAGGYIDITVGETVERGFVSNDTAPILVDVGAGHSAIDIERLIAAEPDLVIGTADYECQRTAIEACRRVGIPAILLRVESFSDYSDVLSLFCTLTGEEERIDTLGSAVGERIEEIKSEFSLDGGRYLLVRAGTSARSTKPKTSEESFVCRMLDELGGENIANESGLGELSLEAILEAEPEYLFITTMGNEAAAKDYMDSLLDSPGWRELDCVKSGRYAYLPRELFHFKPNSRWADAYEYLARLWEDRGIS